MEGQNYHGKGALDAFLNLLSLITLGWMSIAIGITLFQIIDKFFGSQMVNVYNQFSQSGLKFGVASALIITPIFILVINFLHQQYKKLSLDPQSGIYRWLTYLVMLIAALNIIGRLIQLVFQFLEGSYTLASVLKILVVLVIAGCIFGYYWYDLKRTDYSKRSAVSQIFMWVVVVVAVASIVGAFFVIDTPQTARVKKYDQQRVDNLNQIKNIITTDYISSGILPSDLSAPKFSNLVDPESKQPYQYQVLAETKYELCVNFAAPADKWDNNQYFSGENWDFHQAGRQCYEQTVSELNSKIPMPMK